MRKTIWKYSVPIIDCFSIELPETAKILEVAQQGNYVYMWCELYTEAELVTRKFALFGTDFDLPTQPMTHIKTFQKDGFVWHLYELPQ